MTERELEQRLRAWYRDEVAEEAPSASLAASVATIPDAGPVLRWPWQLSRRHRTLALFSAALLLGAVLAGTVAVGSALLRPLPSDPESILPGALDPCAVLGNAYVARRWASGDTVEGTPGPARLAHDMGLDLTAFTSTNSRACFWSVPAYPVGHIEVYVRSASTSVAEARRLVAAMFGEADPEPLSTALTWHYIVDQGESGGAGHAAAVISREPYFILVSVGFNSLPSEGMQAAALGLATRAIDRLELAAEGLNPARIE